MDRVGILINEDNSISIVLPASHNLSFDELEEVIDKANHDNKPYAVVERSSIPKDRTFRNAWEFKDNTIKINRGQAELLHMNRLRFLRNEQLSKLDISVIKSLEQHDIIRLESIKDLRQKLRDLPASTKLDKIDLKKLPTYQPSYLEGDVSLLRGMTPNV